MSTAEVNIKPDEPIEQDKASTDQDNILSNLDKFLIESTTEPNMVLLSSETVMIVYNTETNKLTPYCINDGNVIKCSKRVVVSIAAKIAMNSDIFPMYVLGYRIIFGELDRIIEVANRYIDSEYAVGKNAKTRKIQMELEIEKVLLH